MRKDGSVMFSVTNLICEDQKNPVIGIGTPHFGWQLQSSRRNVVQTAYRIRVALSQEALWTDENLLWDTGIVQSNTQSYVPYDGPALRSQEI